SARMALACVGRPNCGLAMTVSIAEYVTWFSTFVAARRHSRLTRPRRCSARATLASSPNVAGPRIELRPASPHVPGAGAVYAPGFAYVPCEGAVEAPVSIGRTPTTPDPATVRNDTGVTGSPLPDVSWAAIVQFLKSVPLTPSTSVPPVRPMPVVYCTCAARRWR